MVFLGKIYPKKTQNILQVARGQLYVSESNSRKTKTVMTETGF